MKKAWKTKRNSPHIGYKWSSLKPSPYSKEVFLESFPAKALYEAVISSDYYNVPDFLEEFFVGLFQNVSEARQYAIDWLHDNN